MPRDNQFTLRGKFAEQLSLPGPQESVYRFLSDPETLLPLVAGVERIVAHEGGAYRLVFVPVGTGSLRFLLELEVRVTGDGSRAVTLQSVPTNIPPLAPGGVLGDFRAVLSLAVAGSGTAVHGDAQLTVVDTIPPFLQKMPRMLLERTTSLAVNKQMETIGRDLMRNIATAYPDWRVAHPD